MAPVLRAWKCEHVRFSVFSASFYLCKYVYPDYRKVGKLIVEQGKRFRLRIRHYRRYFAPNIYNIHIVLALWSFQRRSLYLKCFLIVHRSTLWMLRWHVVSTFYCLVNFFKCSWVGSRVKKGRSIRGYLVITEFAGVRLLLHVGRW